MTRKECDRLVVLRKARDKKLTQKLAGEELGVSERHMRSLVRKRAIKLLIIVP